MKVTLAMGGAALMFLGWVVAIVPAIRDAKSILPVVIVAVIGFGIILVPAAAAAIRRDGRGKPTVGRLLVGLIPVAIVFLITVLVLPIGGGARLLAIILEVAGACLYAWAWYAAGRTAAGRA